MFQRAPGMTREKPEATFVTNFADSQRVRNRSAKPIFKNPANAPVDS